MNIFITLPDGAQKEFPEGISPMEIASTISEGLARNVLSAKVDGVVIEGDAIRRRTVEDVIGGAFPAARPRDGDTTFSTGEGKQCTCLNLCPPWPLPCCNCSSHMNRYINMPGSSPLN